jgi:hypothetical protein
MRFLIDENLSGPRLASRLRAQGHDPVLAGNVGLLSVTDVDAVHNRKRKVQGTATPATALWANAKHNPNPFIAKRFGSPGKCLGSADSAFARPNVRARTAPRTRAGMRLKRLSFREKDGDRSGAAMPDLCSEIWGCSAFAVGSAPTRKSAISASRVA